MNFLNIKWDKPNDIPKQLSEEVDEMLRVDMTDLQGDLMRVLHDDAQIIKHCYKLSVAISEAEIELKKVANNAIHFYNFESQRKLTATQIQMAIKNDVDIAEEEHKINILRAQLSFFEEIQKQLKQKSWNIKTIIDWEIFTQGNK